MERSAGERPLFPPDRAFVVQFRQDSSLAGTGYPGRVEHIQSGRSARFQDSGQLFAFMERTLAELSEPDRGGVR